MEDRQALGTSTDGARSLYNLNWSERDLMSTDFIIYEAKAFYNAIRQAKACVDGGVIEAIEKSI